MTLRPYPGKTVVDVTQVKGLVSERNRLTETLKKLVGAVTWLTDDLQDAGEDRNPETGEVYDSVAYTLTVKAKAEALLKELGVL